MEIRRNDGKLMLDLEPKMQTVSLVRKRKWYDVRLGSDSYYICNERSKYEISLPNAK
ncbi:MAG: hypothetical protein LUF25_00905 [Phascolarctobacterium sp.]|nr:hypothetical protein [Phascolarctobacterium sp.]